MKKAAKTSAQSPTISCATQKMRKKEMVGKAKEMKKICENPIKKISVVRSLSHFVLIFSPMFSVVCRAKALRCLLVHVVNVTSTYV